jgi:eukaryotic-like serine/threonine-protein kinase
VSTHGALLGDRYRVRRPLGLGGMAQVLLCEDEKLGRLVAVKRLHAESADDVERRFLREARLGAALNHPNLVSVFDTVADDDGLLIVMEYVEGEALTRALRRGPLELDRVVRMARDVAAGLDHAHAHGVIHRDVKPGNVLLRSDGVTKLADLGIATAVDLTRITHSGELLGTAAYMAPEQLEGGEARPASDVYALAAVCFEALAGARPRSGRNAVELAHRIATEPPPDLRAYAPTAPAEAADVLQRGMARDPDERPASAGSFATELARSLGAGGSAALPDAAVAPTRVLPAPRPVHKRPPAPAAQARPAVAQRPSTSARRRRSAMAFAPLVLLALAGAVVAVLLLSSGGGGADRSHSQSARQPASGAQQPDDKAKPKPKKPKPKKPSPESSAPAADQPPADAAPPATGADPERGAQLDDQGFALMRRGDYANAVPILQQAVAAWPSDSTDLRYAYALFNLGKALNRSGRAAEAIPYLEKRLIWDDQRATVQAELDLARQNAGE